MPPAPTHAIAPRRLARSRFAWPHRAHAGARGRLRNAIGVALATMGWAPAGPAAPAHATDALRSQMTIGSPLFATVSYLRAGDAGGVRVIMVHGTPGSATAWADYLLSPPPGTELVALDRPGFGSSGPADAVTRLVDQAAAVSALLTDHRPALLVGHSLGGAVVARVAADQPERVAALVLLAASLDPALETIHPMQRLGAWAPIKALLPRAIRNANAELMALKPELQALEDALPRITAKVVIVHGTDDDLVPVANVPFLQSRLRGARCVRVVLLEGRNHFLPWNSEAAVRDAIRIALEPSC